MTVRLILAFVIAFATAAVVGKFYVPWLRKRGASQPLKEEVARIYEENEHDRL